MRRAQLARHAGAAGQTDCSAGGRPTSNGGHKGGSGSNSPEDCHSFSRLQPEHLVDNSMWWDKFEEEEGSSGAQC